MLYISLFMMVELDVIHQVMLSPDEELTGRAAVYGMAQTIPQ